MSAVSTISPTGYDIIWCACDERKLFFPFKFEGCLDLDDSAILYIYFFEYFSKDSYMSKNVVSKSKANYKLMLLVHIGKNYQEIIRINITKVFI